MILTSPSKDVDQVPPVTTTFDPPNGTGVARPAGAHQRRIDWARVERLYSFVRARASDRLRAAEQRQDHAAQSDERRCVHALDAIFTQARQGEDVLASCAIKFFRARAMRDAHHPEFLGEWLGT